MLAVIVVSIIAYITIAVIVGVVITVMLFEKGIIEGRPDAETFGGVCGVLWPVSPFLLLMLWVGKETNRRISM